VQEVEQHSHDKRFVNVSIQQLVDYVETFSMAIGSRSSDTHQKPMQKVVDVETFSMAIGSRSSDTHQKPIQKQTTKSLGDIIDRWVTSNDVRVTAWPNQE
jgi:hypothetical protein